MKIKYLHNILLSFFLCSCSSVDNDRVKEKTSDKETLTIEIENTWVREYPTDGEVIFKLETGSICEVLKKDKKEIIAGKADYWYKIKYDNKEGWVFGSQTSLKQKPIDYSIPRQLKIDQKLEFGMCKGDLGCLIEEFYPIGWSDDRYFAYMTQPENEAIGGFDLTITIQDMQNDKIEWQWKYNEYKKKHWNEKMKEDIVTIWNNNSEQFNQKLNEYGIEQIATNNILMEFPINLGEKTYTTRIEKKGRENRVFGRYEIGNETIIFNGEGLGSKIVYHQNYGPYKGLLNSIIIGAIVANNNKRIAILKVNENRGWEGPPNILTVQVIGCHLEEGF